MARIVLDNVCIDFPIYGATGRSLKNIAFSTFTGGVIASNAHRVVVVRALDGVSFECFDGDRVGLMGPNGSGKSTLLRAIAGIYEPSRGRVEVTGSLMSMLSIMQGMNGDLTGVENIKLRMVLLGKTTRQAKQMIDEITEFSELGEFINMPLRTYSSGMTMRLAFSVATAVDSPILLMDEWLSVGDASFSAKAKLRLDQMVQRTNILVIASHDKNLIDGLCNKKFMLEHGKIAPFD